MKLELHAQVESNDQLALELLQTEVLSRKQIISCFENGAVWLQSHGKPVRLYDPNALLSRAQKLHLYCNQNTLTPCPYQAELVQDFEDFSIWNKPSGMLCQGSKWGDHWTLHRWVKKHVWPQRACLVSHRIDRFTQGLVIVAHSDEVNRRFHRQFEQREIIKTYRAIVAGIWLKDEPLSITTSINNKKAQTDIRLIDRNNQNSLLEIKPQTGRKHQIRIHLSQMGHPVKNDRLYGQPPFNGDMLLQSCAVEFRHPLTESMIKVQLHQDKLLQLA